jgi:protein SCO1/2
MCNMNVHAAHRALRNFLNFVFTLAFAAGVFATLGLAGCGSSKPAAQQQAQQPADGSKRYQLAGRVVAVQPSSTEVVVDHGDIPGFMMAMTMPYPVKDPNQLKPLSPEDQIKADVVVNGNDVYLENIVVTKKADQAKPSAGSNAPAAPSDSKKDSPKL